MTKKKEIDFLPLNSNVTVDLIENKDISDGGVLLPNPDRTPIATGVIVAIGENVLDIYGNKIPIDIEVGDTVFFLRTQGLEISPGSDRFLVAYKSLIGRTAR